MDWVEELTLWLKNPSTPDQNAESKSQFIKIAKVGPPTRLSGLGISNGKLKRYASYLVKTHQPVLSENLEQLNLLYSKAEHTETLLVLFFIIERLKKQVDSTLFYFLEENWIPKIDHWTTADHMCINVFGYIPLNADIIKRVEGWTFHDNFWFRRLSITFYLKHLKNRDTHPYVIRNIDVLKNDPNYYVRKGIPWVVRTLSKQNLSIVEKFLEQNVESLTKTELREACKYLSKPTQLHLLEKYELTKS